MFDETELERYFALGCLSLLKAKCRCKLGNWESTGNFTDFVKFPDLTEYELPWSESVSLNIE